MRPTAPALIACALLSSGCLPRSDVLPDEHVPHRVAIETTATVWAKRPDGRLVQERVRVLPGWWLSSPLLTEGPAP